MELLPVVAAFRVTIFVISIAIVVGTVLWILTELKISFLPAQVGRENTWIVGRPHTWRARLTRHGLLVFLLSGALGANAIDLLTRDGDVTPTGLLVLIFLTMSGAAVMWVLTRVLLAGAMTWTPPPRTRWVFYGGKAYRQRVRPTSESLRRNAEVARAIRALPIGRLRFDPADLIRPDKNAFTIQGSEVMVRATWIATAIDDGVIDRSEVPWELLGARESRLLGELEYVRSLGLPEWASLEAEVRARPGGHPYRAALAIEEVLETSKHFGGPKDGARVSFFKRSQRYSPVYLSPWSMAWSLPSDSATLDDLRNSFTADGDDRPDEVGNARAIASLELRGCPGKFGMSAIRFTTQVVFEAVELCNGVDQIAIAACWLDPVIANKRMSPADLAAEGVSPEVLEVLALLENVRNRTVDLLDLSRNLSREDRSDRNWSLERLMSLPAEDALAFRALLINSADWHIVSAEMRAEFM